jgi:hypothetical protein
MKPAETYIFFQPHLYQSIMLHLHHVIQQKLPENELLFKWGIPYVYYKNKPFCYLAPNHKKGFVDLGFAKGFQLQRNQVQLVDEKRNTVKSLRYTSLETIDHEVLVDVLAEAIDLY